jgi:hypothetical protein
MILVFVLMIGCSGGSGGNPVLPETSASVNPDPYHVSVYFDMPVDVELDDIIIFAGLREVVREDDHWVVSMLPGQTQLVIVKIDNSLAGMAIIIDSSIVPSVTISPYSTLAASFFATPYVVTGDLNYDLPTWEFILALDDIASLSENMAMYIDSEGIENIFGFISIEDSQRKYIQILNSLWDSEPVRQANGFSVDPYYNVNNLRLVDKFWTPESNDLSFRNYTHKYIKVTYDLDQPVPNEVWVEPYGFAAPGESSFSVSDPQGSFEIKAYTIGSNWTGVESVDYHHLIDIYAHNACLLAVFPLLKIYVGGVPVEILKQYSLCGKQLLINRLHQIYSDEALVNLLNAGFPPQVVMAIAVQEMAFAFIDDFNLNGSESCIEQWFEPVFIESIKSGADWLSGLPIFSIIGLWPAANEFSAMLEGYEGYKVIHSWNISELQDAILTYDVYGNLDNTAPYIVNYLADASGPDSDTFIYFWQFGDGKSSLQKQGSHTYECPGTYHGRVTILDNNHIAVQSEIFEITVSKPANYPTALYVGDNPAVMQAIDDAGFHLCRFQDADKHNVNDQWTMDTFDLKLFDDIDLVVVEDLPAEYNQDQDPVGEFLQDFDNKGVVLINFAPMWLEIGNPSDYLVPPLTTVELNSIGDWFGSDQFRMIPTLPLDFNSVPAFPDPFGLVGWNTTFPIYDNHNFNENDKVGSVDFHFVYGEPEGWDSLYIAVWQYYQSSMYSYAFGAENNSGNFRTYFQSATNTDNSNTITLLTEGIKWVGESILVQTSPPVAICEADKTTAEVDQPISFDGSASYDPDGGEITKWSWDFNNDGIYEQTDNGPIQEWSYNYPGTYEVMLRVKDDDDPAGYDTLDEPLQITVENSPGTDGWARTWGGSGAYDYGYSVAIDGSGNAFVTGSFSGTVDFDPGPGVDNHTSNGNWDVFLSKFDSNGDLLWARTWGGSVWDWGYSVAIDGSGNALVTGSFGGTVDFDPGPGVDNHTANGNDDAFISKFDSNGDLLWARTWGGSDSVYGNSVAIDGSGNAYVTGEFYNTADFDPGPGVDNHTSNGFLDVFLSKFDSNGDFLWARTWGGSDDDKGYSVGIDGSGNAYVTGFFEGTVDFDPGPGVDNHTSTGGSSDVFLSKFDSNGDFLWARTWGESGYDKGYSVAIDGSGNAFVTGYFFKGPADFDPGPGVDNHTSNGSRDVFLSKFDSNGDFLWARTWGGSGYDYVYSVGIDGSGNAYVTGCFEETVDFDPGPGVDNHTSNGYYDAFLSKFPPDGNW